MSQAGSKKVLLITPFFAPQSHAAVFRMFKLAKYLPQFGYTPIVLTTDTNYNFKEDASLLNQLPPEVEIHRARFIEPTLRGVRMALGGRDRSYSNIGTTEVVGAVEQEKGAKDPFLRRSYRWLLDHELNNPDGYWPWVKPAIQMGQKLIKTQGIVACVTSSFPYSCNVIGRELQKSGCHWIADFRDPLLYCHRSTSQIEKVYLRQKKIIDDTFEHADALTGLSSCYRLIFSEYYPDQQVVNFIPTGLDEELLPQSSTPEKNQIIFTGEYLPHYDGQVFEVYRRALDSQKIPSDSTILIVGYRDINQPRLKSTLERWDLLNHVEFIDHLPQKELYELIAGAKAGLLNPGVGATWWTNFAKVVDFIAMRKPVVAAISDPSEARTELSRAGLGVFLDGPMDQDIEKLSQVFTAGKGAANVDYCERYLAKNMAAEFAQVFDSLD